MTPHRRIKLFGPRHLRLASAKVAKLLDCVRNAHHQNNRAGRFLASRHYLQSYDARCLAVWEAYRALPARRRRGLGTNLPQIADSLNVWSKSKEPAVVCTKKKGDDDYRLVVDFGIVNRARQYMVERLVAATANLHPEQYLTRGGVPAAIKRVAALMLDGYDYAIETDIRQCYPSFTAANMHTALSLPKEVIDNVIMAQGYNLIPGDSLLYLYGHAPDDEGVPRLLGEQIAKARRGIPHGSAVASLAVEVVLAPVLKALPSVAIVLSYADNILIMAKTKEDVWSATTAMWSALQGHPVGPLTPSLRGEFGPSDPSIYVGHRLEGLGSKVKITPSEKNEAKFHAKFVKRLSKVKDAKASLKVKRARARDLKRYVSSWTGAFSSCDGMDERKKAYLTKINTALATN
jgi:hypothetical protein